MKRSHAKFSKDVVPMPDLNMGFDDTDLYYKYVYWASALLFLN